MLGMPNLADAKAGSHQGFAPTPPSHGRMGGSTTGESASPLMLPGWRFCVSSNGSPLRWTQGAILVPSLAFWACKRRDVRHGWGRGAPSPPASALGANVMVSPACAHSCAGRCFYPVCCFPPSVPLLQTVERVATRFVLNTCVWRGRSVNRGSTRSDIAPGGNV